MRKRRPDRTSGVLAAFELRYFGGLSIEETAEREWAVARVWLRRLMGAEEAGAGG